MNNILRHEMQHIKNKDILIKHLFNIISIIYWWFYPIYILKRQIDLFLEMRIDVTVNEKANVDEQKDYLNTLLTIQEKQHEKKSIDAALSNCIINEGTKTLTKRVHYLIAGQRKKKRARSCSHWPSSFPFSATASFSRHGIRKQRIPKDSIQKRKS